jgi:hypothetical protein
MNLKLKLNELKNYIEAKNNIVELKDPEEFLSNDLKNQFRN